MHNDEFINIGKITKPHGLEGKVKADLETSFLKNHENLSIYLNLEKPEIYKVLSISFTNKMAVLELAGIDNLAKAEKLRNQTIFVERSEINNLAENEFLVADLIGLQVLDEENQLIGEVCDFENIPNNPLLKIKLTNEKCFLLPFSYEFMQRIDINKKEIYLKNWQWLVI